MTAEQLEPLIGQIVTASFRDGVTVTGRLHGKDPAHGLTSPYAIEYTSPQIDTAYTDNRFHPIDRVDDVLALVPVV